MLLIFDCDGVLVDSEVVVAPVVAGLFSAHGAVLGADEVLERYTGLANAEMIRQVARDFSVTFPDGFLDVLERAELDALERDLRPVPGMAALLDGFGGLGGEGGVPMCVASSSAPERIRLSLEVTQLAGYFGHNVFSAAEVARPKPAPDLFLRAAAAMGATPAECMVVEDSVFGVAAGVAAGMRVIGFTAASHGGSGADVMLLGAGAESVASDAEELSVLLGG
jgi:beta-phosphoglucomutase-like phosphatase (HAD superfamily)